MYSLCLEEYDKLLVEFSKLEHTLKEVERERDSAVSELKRRDEIERNIKQKGKDASAMLIDMQRELDTKNELVRPVCCFRLKLLFLNKVLLLLYINKSIAKTKIGRTTKIIGQTLQTRTRVSIL